MTDQRPLIKPYDFHVWAIFKEGWQRAKGVKGIILAAFLIYCLAQIFAVGVKNWLDTISLPLLQAFVGFMLMVFLQLPLKVGLVMMSVDRAVGFPIKIRMVFRYFGWDNGMKLLRLILWLVAIFIPFIFVMIVAGMMVGHGLLTTFPIQKIVLFVLIMLALLYLMVSYAMVIPLMFEKNLSAGTALTISRKAVTQHWFKVFAFILCMLLIIIVGGVVTVGIGLIWIIPWVYIAYGVLYKTMFGIESIMGV